MENMYDNKDFFRIVIGGVETLIKEPVDWAKILISLLRDKDWHGFNNEFVDDNIKLLFPFKTNCGGQELKNTYDELLGDATAKLQYGFITGGVTSVEYEGNLNFNTYDWDEEGVTISCEKVFFGSLLRTRWETLINMNATSTLDGVAITPPDAIQVLLHSKKITKLGKAERVSTDTIDYPSDGGDELHQTRLFIQLDTTNITTSEVSEIQGLPLGITGDNVTPWSESRYQFKATEAGLTSVNATFNARVLHIWGSNSANRYRDHGNYTLQWFIVVMRGGVVISETYQTIDSGVADYRLTYNNAAFTLNTSVNLAAHDELSVGICFNNIVYGARCYISGYYGSLTLSQATVAPASYTQGYRIIDILRHLVNVTTGRDMAVVSTDFGDGGKYEKEILTNGYGIRNFVQTDKPIQFSLKNVLEGLQYIWATGIGYGLDVDGNDVMVLGEMEQFYGDEEVLRINDIYEYGEGHATEVTFNEAEIGYAKYSEDDLNTLDEFNTYHQYLLPIKTYKAKKTLRCPFISSGYTIEKQRREQFKDNPSTSLTNDDDTFIICYVDGTRDYQGTPFTANSTGVTFNRVLDLVVGDVFEIVGGQVGSNAGTQFAVTGLIPGVQDGYLVAPAANTDTGTGIIKVTLAGPAAEKDESFVNVSGVLSPSSAYNLRISPLRMFFRWAFYFNVSTAAKLDSEQIICTYVKNNGDLTTQMAAGLVQDTAAGALIVDKQNVVLSDYGGRRRPHTPVTNTFKAKLSWDDVQQLRRRLLAWEASGQNYGYIVYYDPFRVPWKADVQSLKYNPTIEEAQFEVKKIAVL